MANLQAQNLNLVQMSSSESRQYGRKASHQFHSQHGHVLMPHTVKNQQQAHHILKAQEKSFKRRKSPKL